jgi:hypothetical protein
MELSPIHVGWGELYAEQSVRGAVIDRFGARQQPTMVLKNPQK